MSTVFYHRPHHALVVFDGQLGWPSALELVETLDAVVETYHYDAIELVVTSPGGDTDALGHVLGALRAFQARCVDVPGSLSAALRALPGAARH